MSTIDDVSNAMKVINANLNELRELARSFSLVGNGKVSEDLYYIANAIDVYANVLRNAHSDLLDEAVSSSQQATVNMLNAALAGIVVAKKK